MVVSILLIFAVFLLPSHVESSGYYEYPTKWTLLKLHNNQLKDNWDGSGALAPRARYDGLILSLKGTDYVFLFGGIGSGAEFDTWLFDTNTELWSTADNGITPNVRMHGVSAVTGEVLIFGGYTTDGSRLNLVEKFDHDAGVGSQWTSIFGNAPGADGTGNIPQPRQDGAMFQVKHSNAFYACFGYGPGTFDFHDGSTLYHFDVDAGWQPAITDISLPTDLQDGRYAVAYWTDYSGPSNPNKGWIYGGDAGHRAYDVYSIDFSVEPQTNWAWTMNVKFGTEEGAYPPSASAWPGGRLSPKAAMNHADTEHRPTVLIYGGDGTVSGQEGYRGDVWEFDLDLIESSGGTSGWSFISLDEFARDELRLTPPDFGETGTAFPGVKADPCGVAIHGGKMYLFGGQRRGPCQNAPVPSDCSSGVARSADFWCLETVVTSSLGLSVEVTPGPAATFAFTMKPDDSSCTMDIDSTGLTDCLLHRSADPFEADGTYSFTVTPDDLVLCAAEGFFAETSAVNDPFYRYVTQPDYAWVVQCVDDFQENFLPTIYLSRSATPFMSITPYNVLDDESAMMIDDVVTVTPPAVTEFAEGAHFLATAAAKSSAKCLQLTFSGAYLSDSEDPTTLRSPTLDATYLEDTCGTADCVINVGGTEVISLDITLPHVGQLGAHGDTGTGIRILSNWASFTRINLVFVVDATVGCRRRTLTEGPFFAEIAFPIQILPNGEPGSIIVGLESGRVRFLMISNRLLIILAAVLFAGLVLVVFLLCKQRRISAGRDFRVVYSPVPTDEDVDA